MHTAGGGYRASGELDLNAMIGRILLFTAIIVPFWLVRAMAISWSETFEVLPAILVTGLSFWRACNFSGRTIWDTAIWWTSRRVRCR